MKDFQFFATILFSVVALSLAAVQIDKNLQNKNVERSIDLTTQLVKIQYKITVENLNKKDLVGVSYTFVVPTDHREQLSYISIKDALKKELKPIEEKISEGVAFTVLLTGPVLHIEIVLTSSLEPYPTHITQSERQLVRYFGNAYFYSPYKTVAQKTTVRLASKNVESYTTVKPSAQLDKILTYGPYENVAG